MLGIVLKLLAQTHHMRIHRAMAHIDVLPPHHIQELVPGNDFTPALQEQYQHLEFFPRQLDLLLALEHFLASSLHPKLAQLERVCFLPLRRPGFLGAT